MTIRSFLLTTALASLISFSVPQAAQAESVMCTMDAKLCPDGSSVGRTGPNCEFSPCPAYEDNGEDSGEDSTDNMDDMDDTGDDADAGEADSGSYDAYDDMESEPESE